MAAPKSNTSKVDDPRQAKTRAAIQTTQLVKRLSCFALNTPDDAGNVVELDPNRLRAIEILLRKTLPDLSAVNIDAALTHDVADPLAMLLGQIAEQRRRVTDRD